MAIDNELAKLSEDLDEKSTRYDSVGDALTGVATTVGGAVSGAVGATLGLPTDLVGILSGLKEAASAEDGKRLDAFANGFSEFSKENLGSQYYKGVFDKFVDSLDIDNVLKNDAKAGFSAGELITPPIAGGGAVKAVTKIDKIKDEFSRAEAMAIKAKENATRKVDEIGKEFNDKAPKTYTRSEVMAMTAKREPSPVVQRKKSKLRTLVDALPESEKALLPKQADDFSVAGYHGTSVSRDSDKPFFDISFGRNQDEFLGEGFYFTLDPKVASEYANLRAINQLVDAGKRGGEGLSIYKPTGQKVTTSTLLKGVDIDGQPIPVGQQVAKFDLSNLEKPYVVKTLKDRIFLKENFQKVKDEGYDSVLFDNFKDRSKQIMVFPEHIGKIDEGSGALKQGSTSSERYIPKEASPLEIGTSKFAVEGKLKSNYTTETIKLFDDKLKNIKTAGSPKADELIGTPVKDGTKVGIRKNLNSSTVDGEKGVLQTIHTNNYNGKALSYQPYATVENVTFNVNQKHRQRIASKAKGLAVPEASGKFNMASVDGNYVSNRNLLSEGYDTEISFNPALGHLYTDVTTGQAVKSADTATVIGNRVFANGVTYWKKADAPKPIDASDGTKLTGEVRYKFNRGGLMARA